MDARRGRENWGRELLRDGEAFKKKSAWLYDGVVPAYSRNSRGEERDVWEEEFEPPI